MLLAPASGVAVIFEAKVLSDILTHVTFDLARNQLARSIDVMLEENPTLPAPLSCRKPERTYLVLLTPALTQPGRAGDAISKSRLYGWLMPAYKDPHSSLLCQHLPHRDSHQLAESAERFGVGELGGLPRRGPRCLPLAHSRPVSRAIATGCPRSQRTSVIAFCQFSVNT